MAEKNKSFAIRRPFWSVLVSLLLGTFKLWVGWIGPIWSSFSSRPLVPSVIKFLKQHTVRSIPLTEVLPWLVTIVGIGVGVSLLVELIRYRRLGQSSGASHAKISEPPDPGDLDVEGKVQRAVDAYTHPILNAKEITQARSVFRETASGVLRLKYLPKKGAWTNANALLLMLYGYRLLRRKTKLDSKEVEESLRQSGCTTHPIHDIRMAMVGMVPVDVEQICNEANANFVAVEVFRFANGRSLRLTQQGVEVARGELAELADQIPD